MDPKTQFILTFVLSAGGSLLGVVVGAGLTYWRETYRDSQKRHDAALRQIVPEITKLVDTVFRVLAEPCQTPSEYAAQGLWAETAEEIAIGIEEIAMD